MSDTARLGWPQYFMQIAHLVAKRSTCLRRQVGAVAVKDRRILSTGYNGAPANVAHCVQIGCLREQRNVPSGQSHELCRGLHAEQNVIVQAAIHDANLRGATLYCTTQPCLICMKMLINCEITTIYHAQDYSDEFALEMAKESGLDLILLPLKETTLEL